MEGDDVRVFGGRDVRVCGGRGCEGVWRETM